MSGLVGNSRRHVLSSRGSKFLFLSDYGKGVIDPYDIEKGPYIIAEPKSVVIFNNVPLVYIECGAYANPHPTFSWRRILRDKTVDVTSETDNR